jgi:putative acetyltransferase
MDILIKEERASDFQQIAEINNQAFNRDVEGKLVELLRKADCEIISLVAEVNKQIVGHIMFSPVEIENKTEGMILAPIAVLPEFQKKGIGAKLIKKGAEEVKSKNYSIIILFGHPEYYPKFGFAPASRYGLKSKIEAPDEVFMALNFSDKNWKNSLIKFRPEFDIFV